MKVCNPKNAVMFALGALVFVSTAVSSPRRRLKRIIGA